jgi:hypothetical protein
MKLNSRDKKIAGSVLIITVFIAGLFLLKNNNKEENFQHVIINGVTLKVDLATTSKEQEQGLSGRVGLKEDEGMLFIFDKPAPYAFWMKDMNFPIDMIWFGEDMHVVYIKRNATPESFPETFTPNQNAKYVLEVVSGFSDKNNIKDGDTFELIK